MIRNIFLMFVCSVLLLSCNKENPKACCSENVCTLVAEKVLPLDYPESIEPSGLAIWKGRLFTVADKDDGKIFEIAVNGDTASIKPFLKIDCRDKREHKLDFEGIAVSQDRFYLASETECEILQVERDGKARWLPLGIRKCGNDNGMFTVHNAGIEGIAALGNRKFLVCAERQPRGLIEACLSPATCGHQLMDQSDVELRKGVSPDFAGLYYCENKLWALFRNAYQIVELKGKIGDYHIVNRYSFAHILLSPKYRYQDMKFGIAEGLAVDAGHFYVVVDNNCMARLENQNDHRPLLLILKRPGKGD